MRSFTSHAVAILLLAAIASAADVSGKWTGTLQAQGEDGQPVSIPAHMEFKQSGGVITGSVWKDAGHHYAIANGSIKGHHHVKLAVTSEDQLQGDMEFEVDGNKVSAKLKLSRH